LTAPEVDAVFAALADPTRRQLLDQISRHGPLSATELARGYPMSRQAVVKHLSALAHAGLLAGERQGRDVRYRVMAGGLGDAAAWLTEVGDRWDSRLAALQRHLAGGA
jgi:DNA-binding transcriptional ArsR family regulator